MNLLDILRYGHQTVIDVAEAVPRSEWDVPGVCGVWSVRQIIAHLASYEQLLVDVFQILNEPAPTPNLDLFLQQGPMVFNDDQVARRDNLTSSEIWSEYKDTHERTLVLAASLAPSLLRQTGLLTWYGDEYDLEDFIVYSYYGHKREHAAQIAVFIDQHVRPLEAPSAAANT